MVLLKWAIHAVCTCILLVPGAFVLAAPALAGDCECEQCQDCTTTVVQLTSQQQIQARALAYMFEGMLAEQEQACQDELDCKSSWAKLERKFKASLRSAIEGIDPLTVVASLAMAAARGGVTNEEAMAFVLGKMSITTEVIGKKDKQPFNPDTEEIANHFAALLASGAFRSLTRQEGGARVEFTFVDKDAAGLRSMTQKRITTQEQDVINVASGNMLVPVVEMSRGGVIGWCEITKPADLSNIYVLYMTPEAFSGQKDVQLLPAIASGDGAYVPEPEITIVKAYLLLD